MNEEKITRINELYRKSKAEGLTDTEKKEQQLLPDDSFRNLVSLCFFFCHVPKKPPQNTLVPNDCLFMISYFGFSVNSCGVQEPFF